MAVRLLTAVKLNPVEVALSLLFCCLGCVNYEYQGVEGLENLLIYFPVIFLATNLLNRLTVDKEFRWIYFVSIFLSVPFFWVETKIESASYLVTLVVIQLVYLLYGWLRDNDAFIRSGLHYLRALLSAFLLAGVAYFLSVSIYFSISYIFEIWEGGETRFMTYAAYLVFMGCMPLLFLMFHQDEEEEGGENKLFDVLLNYVLTPALLIYAIILYLYFIKITVLWSLPKGAVAYIVVSFTVATFILRGFQPFLSRRYYDWFYKYASFVVLPALAMYWVGTCYRINQYGFTEPRVYLVVVGLILTGIAFLFFSKRLGRYLYTGCLTIVMLSAVTYIPGITAKDIEIMSQKSRGNYPPKEVPKNHSPLWIDNKDVLDISGYQTLQPVADKYNKAQKRMWFETSNDSMFLYDKSDSLIMKKDLNYFVEDRMKSLGLSVMDSIPESKYSQILQLEMDSTLLIFESITLYRYASDSTYVVSNVTPWFYLTKKK